MSLTEIHRQADSLVALLTAQCADLERLLALVQQETLATEACDFDEVLRVVDARSQLGMRLETYHRQIAELRERIGGRAEDILESDAAGKARRMIVEIQAQDRKLLPLLEAKRDETSHAIARLDRTRRGTNAYLNGFGDVKSIACDARA